MLRIRKGQKGRWPILERDVRPVRRYLKKATKQKKKSKNSSSLRELRLESFRRKNLIKGYTPRESQNTKFYCIEGYKNVILSIERDFRAV